MTSHRRFAVRPRVLLLAGAAIGGVALLFVVLASPQVRAGPPPAVTTRDAASVRVAGDQVTLVARSVDGATLVEPRSAGGPPLPAALAPDGLAMAFSPVRAGHAGPLVIARADGSQLDVALPGLRGAAFSPDGEWLAAVDLAGSLWRVEAATGAASLLAEGPFGPDPTVLPDGRVLAVRLSSVEAPIWAAAQLVDPLTGVATTVEAGRAEQDQLVYQAAALVDGSLSLVRHRVGGAMDVIRVTDDGSPSTVATLKATSVAVSPTGERLAWAWDGSIRLDRPDDAAPFVLSAGSAARFSPDGAFLLVFGDRRTSVYDLAGALRAEAGETACWLGDGRGCRP
jgi:hypothetical protein